MSFQSGMGATSLPGVRVRFGEGGVSATVEGLAGAIGSGGKKGGLRGWRRPDAEAPEASTGLVPLARMLDECLLRRKRLRQAMHAADQRRERAQLVLQAASLVVVRLLMWPALETLQQRVREAELQLHAARQELERCAVPVRIDLDPAARAAFARLGRSFDRLAEEAVDLVTTATGASGRQGKPASVRLERVGTGPVLVAGEQSLRLPASARGDGLHLLPGLALLERRDEAFVPLDPRELVLKVERLPHAALLRWSVPGSASGTFLAGDAAAALAFGDAYDAYRRELDRLAARSREAMAASAAAPEPAGDPTRPVPGIAVVPPQTEHRLLWFPLADLAALAAAGLTALLVANPGLLRGAIPLEIVHLLTGRPGAADAPPPAASYPTLPAVSPTKAIVRVDAANIRAKPKADAAVVGRARRGDSLAVLQRRDTWIQVGADEPLGWIREDLVELN
ncbi:SH3 domain-containing protein [Benzoatithermus flavus]|uniref:SH3 domain-containing protein n=1 Tax=Benzoatithermus flavus TaxID=3108223 RepID=A0ABU8XNG1_9PROT